MKFFYPNISVIAKILNKKTPPLPHPLQGEGVGVGFVIGLGVGFVKCHLIDQLVNPLNKSVTKEVIIHVLRP
jgi:hypothetical protein